MNTLNSQEKNSTPKNMLSPSQAPQIELLDDSVISQIAAGEVVERPASVVKELLENSIDAGASLIEIELKEGGLSLISIKDNGHGMDEKNILKAVKRHATSKIKCTQDIVEISSMGFRGEALAAISSVSEMTLASRAQTASSGIKLVLKDSQLISQNAWHGPKGTLILVENLFASIPARAKFMKKPASEFGQCHEIIQSLAFAHPQIGFTLFHNEKKKFTHPPVTSEELTHENSFHGEMVLRKRTEQIWGSELSKKLIYLKDSNPYGAIEALISPPNLVRATGKNLICLVNGRFVKDKTIRYGVLRGYQTHLLKGHHPQAVIHLSCDPALVDVNAHPAKTELRFQYPGEIQGLTSLAIRQAIREADWDMPPGFNALTEEDKSSFGGEKTAEERIQEKNYLASPFSGQNPNDPQKSWPIPKDHSAHQSFTHLTSPQSSFLEKKSAYAEKDLASVFEPYQFINSAEAISSSGILPFEDMEFLGSFAKCYLLLRNSEHLLVLDQHAFHERILWEKLKKDPLFCKQSQPLLFPLTLTMEQSLVTTLQDKKKELETKGLSLDFPDEASVEVLAVPKILTGKPLEKMILELGSPFLDSSDELEVRPGHLSFEDHMLATIACHSAIRAGEELSEKDWELLKREARTVDFYLNCPHGRPVFKWWSKKEVEKWFDR